MGEIVVRAEAGQVSAELMRRGVAPGVRVRALVEVLEEVADDLPMAALAQAGGAFAWLEEEPDIYTEADLLPVESPGTA